MLSPDIEQLDAAISAVLGARAPKIRPEDAQLRALVETASGLHFLPRPEFRARLRADLLAHTSQAPVRRHVFDATFAMHSQLKSRASRDSVLPPLFSTGTSMMPVGGSHLAVSFALHVAALAIVFTSGLWVVKNAPHVRTQIASRLSESVDYILPVEPWTLREPVEFAIEKDRLMLNLTPDGAAHPGYLRRVLGVNAWFEDGSRLQRVSCI